MTTDNYRGHSLTGADLARAAGIEKMARAMWNASSEMVSWDDVLPELQTMYLMAATAALAAWEAHLAETKKPGR